MRTFCAQLSFFSLIVTASIVLACGTSQHTLKAISVSPATAEGQAQFTATGYYSSAPSPVKSLSATWGACTEGWQPTSDVFVNSNGQAQCSATASGTYTVFAFENIDGPASCALSAACGPAPCGTISSTAKMTCP